MGIHTHFSLLATAILEAQTMAMNCGDRFKELKLLKKLSAKNQHQS